MSMFHAQSPGQEERGSIETQWIPLINGENMSLFGHSDKHSGLAFKLLHATDTYCTMQLDVQSISLDSSDWSDAQLHLVFAHGQRISIANLVLFRTSSATDRPSGKSMIKISLNPDQLGMLAVYPIERLLIQLPDRALDLNIPSDDLRQKALQEIKDFYNRIEERK